MNSEYPSLCYPRPDNCHRTPFRVGVDRALALSFPPEIDGDLPERLAHALDALVDVLAQRHAWPEGLRSR